MLIRDRGHRCAYCYFPTKRVYVTKTGARFLVCSAACEQAVRARIEGYDEKRIAFAWNECTEDERRPSQVDFTESGVHPIVRVETSEERHDEGHDDLRPGPAHRADQG